MNIVRNMRLYSMTLMAIAIFMTQSISGQAVFKKADKLLDLKAFDLAIKSYESGLAKYPGHAEGFAQLGKAYLMTNQLLKSIQSFEKAFALEGHVDNEYKLLYGTALKKVGLYDKAESVFYEYASIDPEVANHLIGSTEYAKSILQEPNAYDILSFNGNSEKSDFGTSFFKDRVVFCSFRDDLQRENAKKNISYIQQAGNQMYSIEVTGASKSVKFLRPDFKEIYNIGPLSYSKNGRMVAFMRNTFTTGSSQIYSDESNMSIYLGLTDENGDFTDEKPFPYNQIEYSYAFPSLGYDGNALYFASNRPGGLGGFDIYVSYFRDGRWSQPENLGDAINTPGDEITPYFDGETLYFASNHRYGLGGYDNFMAKVTEGKWANAQNMGKGINSPADDYYLTPNFDQGNYYITSNRLGGRGKDDIYIAYKLADKEEVLAYEEMPAAVNIENLQPPVQLEIPSTETSEADIATVVTVSETDVITEAPPVVEVVNEDLTVDSDIITEPSFKVEIVPASRITNTSAEIVTAQESTVVENTTEENTTEENTTEGNTTEGNTTEENVIEDNAIVEEDAYSTSYIVEEEMELTSLEGAKLTGITISESTPSPDAFASVYFIQLASLSYSEGNMSAYDQIKTFGQLYRFYKSSTIKIRLGYFNTRSEAESTLRSIKNYGFSDAFVTADVLATAEYEVLGSSNNGTQQNWINDYSPSSNFKVKLASYQDPLLFDVNKAVTLGQLEQWTKGKWTIFIVSGYETLESAKRARIRAQNNGFEDAELVEDVNGILKKVND